MSLELQLPHVVSSQNAPKVWEWLKTRGGVAVWKSVNLSNPGMSWIAPAMDAEGNPLGKPNWQCAEVASRTITDPNEIVVVVDQEVKRFRVAIRRGSSGLSMKLTDASSAKVLKAVEKAGQGAHYTFDYETQEAIIWAPASEQTLHSWAHEQGLI